MAKGLTVLSDFHINRCQHGGNFASIKGRLSISGLTAKHTKKALTIREKSDFWTLLKNFLFIHRHCLRSDKANQ